MDDSAPRIALYSPDSYGLGHFRRSRRIARALVEAIPGASVLLLTGCLVADRFSALPSVDLVRLPAATKNPDGSYRSRSLGVDAASLKELRSAILEASLTAFRPDVFVVDHSPGGLAGELRPVLERMHSGPRPALVALGMRDIIDEPGLVRAQWLREGTYELLEWAYDEVWVYGRPEVFDPVAEYRVAHSVAGRFQFLGYVLDGSPAVPHRTAGDHLPHLVALGGGGEDAFPLLRAAVAARARSSRRFRLTIFPGPLMTHHDRAELEHAAAAVGGDVTVHGFTERAQQIAASADAIVTMGGYNSTLEAIAAGVPTLVVPRVRPRLEQLVRAERMAAKGWIRCLHPERLSPESLLEHAWQLLDGWRPTPMPAGYLGGLERLAERCRQALAAVPAAQPTAADGLLAQPSA